MDHRDQAASADHRGPAARAQALAALRVGPPGGGGGPRNFGPPRGPGGRGPDAPPRGTRERVEKKKSTRPKPEERERGNWRWDRNPDDE